MFKPTLVIIALAAKQYYFHLDKGHWIMIKVFGYPDSPMEGTLRDIDNPSKVHNTLCIPACKSTLLKTVPASLPKLYPFFTKH